MFLAGSVMAGWGGLVGSGPLPAPELQTSALASVLGPLNARLATGVGLSFFLSCSTAIRGRIIVGALHMQQRPLP